MAIEVTAWMSNYTQRYYIDLFAHLRLNPDAGLGNIGWWKAWEDTKSFQPAVYSNC